MARGNGKWAQPLSEWKKRSLMQVTLPSGMQVTLRAVTLDELFTEGAVPEHLVQVAILNQQAGALVRKIAAHESAGEDDQRDELMRRNLELRDRLVLRAVVDPALTEDDLADVDPYDKAMIAQISQRFIAEDASGKKVGADSLDSFRRGAARFADVEADPARRALLVELSQLQ